MISLTAQEKEVVDQFRRLPPERRRPVMSAMFATDVDCWQAHRPAAEARLRELASLKGLNWDALDDDQKLEFTDALVHEDRP